MIMSDKTAAEALVASLRQKRQQRKDSLQAAVREKTPESIPSNDDVADEHQKDALTKSEASIVDDDNDDDNDAALLPSLDDDDAEKDNSSSPSLPLQSDAPATTTTTVRERMRQKMLARRERPQAATTDGEASEREGSKSLSMTSRRLRGLRDAKTLMAKTRFDAAESKNEDELEQELAAR